MRTDPHAYKRTEKYKAKKRVYDARPEVKARQPTAAGLKRYERTALLAAQNGACAVCGTTDFKTKGPCIEHCHRTGEIRGVTCERCNRMLAMLGDNADGVREWSTKLLNYLEVEALKAPERLRLIRAAAHETVEPCGFAGAHERQ